MIELKLIDKSYGNQKILDKISLNIKIRILLRTTFQYLALSCSIHQAVVKSFSFLYFH